MILIVKQAPVCQSMLRISCMSTDCPGALTKAERRDPVRLDKYNREVSPKLLSNSKRPYCVRPATGRVARNVRDGVTMSVSTHLFTERRTGLVLCSSLPPLRARQNREQPHQKSMLVVALQFRSRREPARSERMSKSMSLKNYSGINARKLANSTVLGEMAKALERIQLRLLSCYLSLSLTATEK